MSANLSLKDRIAEAARKPGVQLPVFNPVALELQKMVNDNSVPMARIEATLQRDAVLSAQVLRMANTSMYAGLSSITTLRQALTRVGAQQVLRLVMAAAQLSLYQSHLPLFKRHLAAMWKAAYASAIGAAWLAHKSGHGEQAEQAFLAGLLHDVGKLVILRAIEQLTLDKAFERPLPDSVALEMIEALHCEFGYELMQRWNLPEDYSVIGRDHHAPDCDMGNVLMVSVRLIDEICLKMGIGCTPDAERMPAATPEASALLLSDVALADLEVTLEDKLGLNVVAAA